MMRRRQIYAKQIAEAEAALMTIPKDIAKKENSIDPETGRVICGICRRNFDTRGFNTHRRNCK